MKKLFVWILLLSLAIALTGCAYDNHQVGVEVTVVEVTNERACNNFGDCNYTSTIVVEYNGHLYEIVQNHSTNKIVGDKMYYYIPAEDAE